MLRISYIERLIYELRNISAASLTRPYYRRFFRPSRNRGVDYVNRLIAVALRWRHAATHSAKQVE